MTGELWEYLLNIAAQPVDQQYTTHYTVVTGGGSGWWWQLQGPTTNLEEINIFPLGPLVTQDIFRMNWKEKKPEQKLGLELIPLSCWSKNSHGEGCPALSSHFLCPVAHNPVSVSRDKKISSVFNVIQD